MLRRENMWRGFGPLGPEASARMATGGADGETAWSDTLPASEFEIGPRHDDDHHREQHHGRGGKALTEILGEEHVVVDIFCRHFRGDAGAAAGLGDDEVVDLDDAGRD